MCKVYYVLFSRVLLHYVYVWYNIKSDMHTGLYGKHKLHLFLNITKEANNRACPTNAQVKNHHFPQQHYRIPTIHPLMITITKTHCQNSEHIYT